MKKTHFRLLSVLFALCLSAAGPGDFPFSASRETAHDQNLFSWTLPELTLTAYASASWPESPEIQADGGILVDADSGAVLFEKMQTRPTILPASPRS